MLLGGRTWGRCLSVRMKDQRSSKSALALPARWGHNEKCALHPERTLSRGLEP